MAEEGDLMDTLQTNGAVKIGTVLLSEIVSAVYLILQEIRRMNLRAPLQISSENSLHQFSTQSMPSDALKIESPDAPSIHCSELQQKNRCLDSTSDTSQAEAHFSQMNGNISVASSLENIQDSYTKMMILKNHYMRLIGDLGIIVSRLPENGVDNCEKEHESERSLKSRQAQLRKEVYDRNLLIKGLIDRLRQLQLSMRKMSTGNAHQPSFVMDDA